MGWQGPQGKPQEMSCRKALAELDRQGVLQLPPAKRDYGFQRRSMQTLGQNQEPTLPEIEFEGTLKDLGQVTVEPVGNRGSARAKLWVALMRRYHYLKDGPLCGAQLRYVVNSSTQGVIGAVAFSSACWALKAREKYIGWTEGARRENLKRVVNNARFLIVPTVRVANLASHVLSLTTARLASDWEERYGVRPVLVETFVDSERYAGTSYRAANWKDIGRSAGRRDGKRKKIFVYPLSARWKQVLCVRPRRALGQRPAVQPGEDWAQRELGTVELYDGRLKERLYRIAGDFYNRMQGNIPEACGSKAATMAAYRFFANPKVSREVVLTAHKEATLERVREHKVVLAPQDTTFLNYSTHPMTEELGPINNKSDGQRGISEVHSQWIEFFSDFWETLAGRGSLRFNYEVAAQFPRRRRGATVMSRYDAGQFGGPGERYLRIVSAGRHNAEWAEVAGASLQGTRAEGGAAEVVGFYGSRAGRRHLRDPYSPPRKSEGA